MKIGAPRLPLNSSALIVRLGEIFGLIDRTIDRVDRGAIHDSRSVAVSSDIQQTDSVLFADASAGTVVLTLMPAVEAENKRITVVKTTAGNAVNVAGTINGTAVPTVLTTQYSSAEFVSNGTEWVRL